MTIALEQIRAARGMLDLKQHELAKKAGISTGTLNNIERGVQTDPKISTLRAIQKALEAEGIEFTESPTGGMGVQLKPKRNKNGEVKLLIVDDSNADRKLYTAWLKKQSATQYSIIEADNARQGYEAFVKHAPDCIILDFMMYGVDGFQLLVEMQRDHTVLPPIIFVTGMHNPVLEESVKAAGARACLNKKGLTPEKLQDAITRAVA